MKIFPLMLAVIFGVVLAVPAQKEASDIVALTALTRELANSQVAFDRASLDRIFTADYIEISPAGEFDPREKVLGFYKPELKPATVPTLVVSDLSIRPYGKFAVVIARLTYVMSPDPAAPSRSMRVTLVCRKEKSGWKIASSQYTGIRPPQPPKS